MNSHDITGIIIIIAVVLSPFIYLNGLLNVVGLLFDIVGAAVLSYGLIIDEDTALELGGSYYESDNREENLRLPKVKDRLRQSRNAANGLALLIFGFILQIIGS